MGAYEFHGCVDKTVAMFFARLAVKIIILNSVRMNELNTEKDFRNSTEETRRGRKLYCLLSSND